MQTTTYITYSRILKLIQFTQQLQEVFSKLVVGFSVLDKNVNVEFKLLDPDGHLIKSVDFTFELERFKLPDDKIHQYQSALISRVKKGFKVYGIHP